MPTTTSRAYLEIIATDRATRVMSGLEETFKRFGSQLLGLAGLGGGLYGLKRGFDACLEAAMESEKVQANLASSLRATGEYSDETMGRLIRFARSMQDVTTWSNEAVLGLAEYVHTLGVGAYQIEEATRMTLGLSKALRVDEQAAAKMAASALQGHFEKFTRYIPAIKDARTEAEKFALVQDKVKTGLDIAAAETETLSGALAQMKNSLSDIAGIIAEPVVPTIADMAETIKTTSGNLQELIKYLDEYPEHLRKIQQAQIEAQGPQHPGVTEEERGAASQIRREQELIELWGEHWQEIEQANDEMLKLNKETEVLRQTQEDLDAEFENWYETTQYIGEVEAEWEAYTEELDRAALAQNRMAVTGAAQWATFHRLGEAAIGAGVKVKTAAEEMAEATEETARRMKWLVEEATEIKSIGEIGLEAAITFKRGFGEAFADVLMKVETLEDAFRSLGLAIIRSMLVNIGGNIGGMVNQGLLSAGTNILMSLFGGPAAAAAPSGGVPGYYTGTAHAGGIIGETSFPMRMLPAWAFEGAPRLHAGLMRDEFPAILQRGETVIPKGNVQNTMVIIKNEGSEKLEVSRAEQYMLGDQRIIDVTTRAMSGSGPYRHALQQAAQRT